MVRTINRRELIRTVGAVGTTSALASYGVSAQDDEDEGESRPAEEPDVDTVAADPADVPDPVDWNEPRRHEIEIETRELVAEVESGVTYPFMTFGGEIPGPFVRVREGDVVHLTFTVPDEFNADIHNMDFHAVYGPGGGAEDTTIAPGDEAAEIEFTARYPGAFFYHCAPGQHDYHIGSGMFGTILVEPQEGLPEVDREYYLGQHELYTDMAYGEEGHHTFDFDAAADENPTYVLFNGEQGRFTEDGDYGPLEADTEETVRIYWANAGPNLVSGPHPIGNVWTRWYEYGDVVSEPAHYVEGAALPAGVTGIGEIDTPVPGPISLVDHALSRTVRKGLLAQLHVEGDADYETFDPET
ncbi:copper-containing nitrite reductase [Halopiger goleimassiliensis]|uniref:copper-containing nitrite reductase n=1 Tax=Halopiger goleimassiliensis TaxID=1293048 RepID=UPI0006780AA6|nr:copper-containing nitrite reductase [Halopiger goleimassiliensis]